MQTDPASARWQASLLEQRIAWAVAVCCMLLILLAAVRPEWFTTITSTPTVHTTINRQVKTPQPKHTATHHHKAHAKSATTQRMAKKTVAPAATTAPIVSGFYVQLGAFHEHARAQGLADQLQHHSWHAVITTTKGGLHAVWVGPKHSHSAAETLLKSIQHKIKTKGFIVHQS